MPRLTATRCHPAQVVPLMTSDSASLFDGGL